MAIGGYHFGGIGLGLRSGPSPAFGMGGFTGLLDLFPGAAFAMSTRVLSSAFATQYILQVRRDSDDDEAQVLGDPADPNRFITLDSPIVGGGTLGDFVTNGTYGLYNERMYFDGVDDSVVLGSIIDFGTSDFSASATVTLKDGGVVIGSIGTRFLLNMSTTGASIREKNTADIYSFSYDAGTLDQYKTYAVEIKRVGNDISLVIDGVTQSDVKTVPALSEFSVNEIGSRGGAGFFSGIISDVNINGVASYQGYGNTNADWEDQIGSNDGTVNGSPELYTGQPFNAYVSEARDQSGNGRHAVQTTTTDQPRIVNAGVLEVDAGGFAVINFRHTGGQQRLTFDNISVASVFGLTRFGSGNTNSFIADNSASTTNIRSTNAANNRDLSTSGFGGSPLIFSNGNAYTAGTSVENQRLLLSVFADSTTGPIGRIGANPDIGTLSSSIQDVSQVILYSSDQSANRAAIESEIAAAHGITLA